MAIRPLYRYNTETGKLEQQMPAENGCYTVQQLRDHYSIFSDKRAARQYFNDVYCGGDRRIYGVYDTASDGKPAFVHDFIVEGGLTAERGERTVLRITERYSGLMSHRNPQCHMELNGVRVGELFDEDKLSDATLHDLLKADCALLRPIDALSYKLNCKASHPHQRADAVTEAVLPPLASIEVPFSEVVGASPDDSPDY